MAERDEKGRFIKGNKASPGRSTRQREDRYYDILISSITAEDWRATVRKAAEQAKRGDSVARKWLSDYLLGPPQQRIDVTSDGEQVSVILYMPDNGRGDEQTDA